jgi:hypothetical protein
MSNIGYIVMEFIDGISLEKVPFCETLVLFSA